MPARLIMGIVGISPFIVKDPFPTVGKVEDQQPTPLPIST